MKTIIAILIFIFQIVFQILKGVCVILLFLGKFFLSFFCILLLGTLIGQNKRF
jgi:hypothetical protein